MADTATSHYTAEDLDRLRNAFNVPVHVELDPWGSLLVTPVDDDHEVARAELVRQATLQLEVAGHIVAPSMPWSVPAGTSYLMIPDLVVLPAGWQRVGEWGLAPPPLLVVEIASPATRYVDRTRKLVDYRMGGASLYLLVDLPATFEAHDRTTIVQATGAIDLVVGGHPVRFSLPRTSA
jgi:Uma2 family endonuclease